MSTEDDRSLLSIEIPGQAPPSRETFRWSPWDVWRINTLTGRWHTLPMPAHGAILVLGCGTATPVNWARSFPQSRVRAIDPSGSRVLGAKSWVRELGQANVDVELGTLDAVAEGDGPYSLIAVRGLLERQDDPAQALRTLSGTLAPGGIVRLRIPSARRRVNVREFGEMLDVLEQAAPDLDRVEIGEALTHGLDVAGTRMLDTINLARDLYRDHKEGWQDAFMQPALHVYTVTELLELLSAAGLRLISWAHPDDWHIGPRLTDPLMRRLFEDLPDRERWEFVDRLRTPHFELLCGRVDDPEPQRPWMTDDALLLDSLIHSADSLKLVARRGRANPAPSLEHPYSLLSLGRSEDEITLRTPSEFELPIHPFHRDLLNNMDGQRTLREAVALTASAYGMREATASRKVLPLVRTLIHPHEVLVLRPPQRA